MKNKLSPARLFSSLKADLIFQTKQGFLAVYLVVALIYTIILSQLPENIISYAVPIVIFSDPSILGLIFIGGIFMLEKEQGIVNYLHITPLKFSEYMLSKIVSLGLISVIIGVLISLASYGIHANYLVIIAVMLLISMMFSQLGFIVAQNATSVNHFILRAVPYIALAVIPCFSLIGFPYSELFMVFPTVSALKLLIDAYTGLNILWSVIIIVYLVVWNIVFMSISKKVYEKKFM